MGAGGGAAAGWVAVSVPPGCCVGENEMEHRALVTWAVSAHARWHPRRQLLILYKLRGQAGRLVTPAPSPHPHPALTSRQLLPLWPRTQPSFTALQATRPAPRPRPRPPPPPPSAPAPHLLSVLQDSGGGAPRPPHLALLVYVPGLGDLCALLKHAVVLHLQGRHAGSASLNHWWRRRCHTHGYITGMHVAAW